MVLYCGRAAQTQPELSAVNSAFPGSPGPTSFALHMGKGSQLSQLKSALSQAGLSRQSRPGRKRGRAQNEEKDNAKRAARLREIQQKLNPFDVKVTKLKHDVGGRKLRGVSGKPAQSKEAGIETVS